MHVTCALAAKTHANKKAWNILATEAASTSSLKEKGMFTNVSHAMSINATINVVAEALGVEVEGDASQYSICWMVTEGGIAAETQLVDKITCARGILHEVNHTSETQLQGWKHQATEMYSTYNDVMGGHNAADIQDFAPKVKGMLTDHAEDQKKLVHLFAEWKQECDYQQWDLLSPDEWQLHSNKAIHQLHMTFGEKEFASLSSAKKEAMDLFMWAGYCMHKELNVAKGGNTRMQAWWEQNSVDGPVLLMNKDNVAAASVGSSVAKDQAVQVSTGGGQKTLDLVGSVFCHKDDKKGQHDSLQYYLKTELGHGDATFPGDHTVQKRKPDTHEHGAECLLRLLMSQDRGGNYMLGII
ncbi:uncharacterized protein BJ212DRAFT_1303991 [Suillus subaureus]|uniref:Uncharacterized protein n=1 Tax=Suillus subaureus TaxID=48587 RepID=A0A9P7DX90_9AGAM|nr:uncharacterized protein BJ212DRAFT_1303991 [Suillus subaureus]KAG1805530.1 hypothetical protein BJ212DRAFT_1303991 [Suillus subaureus]